MNNQFISHISSELDIIRSEGLFKRERVINTPQSSIVTLDNGQKVIITNDKLPKMILQLEMRHRIYNWGKARREWRNSACVLNNMTISCSNYHTGRHDHVEYNFYPYMEMVAE